ncbi:putative Dol-P-Man:Man(7)GlcNAc(2)-PP-Dol alpha-1,6-mannosyltransferase [Smittium culicis]|uniref:Putative Dol-P-Man:Man(7)GlcNAc(2)-PP-Dol alpha-1,6-mannosyltransferase n=1 Tax=Smittium culicis TaxID=133412 RepID=A0A1R1XEW6_9FUNG|nr:putative Dol-P-Man:Man(7)GlcNAc(2)-PP-Dol alpha-1,6-mannosyltransferase [Smittium culicis]
MTFISSLNYPGGYAMSYVHTLGSNYPKARVYYDTFSAMNGVSRFSENNGDWTYYKTDSELSRDELKTFDFILVNDRSSHDSDFYTVAVIKGYSGISIPNTKDLLGLLKTFPEKLAYLVSNPEDALIANIVKSDKNDILGIIKLSPKVYILKNKNLL